MVAKGAGGVVGCRPSYSMKTAAKGCIWRRNPAHAPESGVLDLGRQAVYCVAFSLGAVVRGALQPAPADQLVDRVLNSTGAFDDNAGVRPQGPVVQPVVAHPAKAVDIDVMIQIAEARGHPRDPAVSDITQDLRLRPFDRVVDGALY